MTIKILATELISFALGDKKFEKNLSMGNLFGEVPLWKDVITSDAGIIYRETESSKTKRKNAALEFVKQLQQEFDTQLVGKDSIQINSIILFLGTFISEGDKKKPITIIQEGLNIILEKQVEALQSLKKKKEIYETLKESSKADCDNFLQKVKKEKDELVEKLKKALQDCGGDLKKFEDQRIDAIKKTKSNLSGEGKEEKMSGILASLNDQRVKFVKACEDLGITEEKYKEFTEYKYFGTAELEIQETKKNLDQEFGQAKTIEIFLTLLENPENLWTPPSIQKILNFAIKLFPESKIDTLNLENELKKQPIDEIELASAVQELKNNISTELKQVQLKKTQLEEKLQNTQLSLQKSQEQLSFLENELSEKQEKIKKLKNEMKELKDEINAPSSSPDKSRGPRVREIEFKLIPNLEEEIKTQQKKVEKAQEEHTLLSDEVQKTSSSLKQELNVVDSQISGLLSAQKVFGNERKISEIVSKLKTLKEEQDKILKEITEIKESSDFKTIQNLRDNPSAINNLSYQELKDVIQKFDVLEKRARKCEETILSKKTDFQYKFFTGKDLGVLLEPIKENLDMTVSLEKKEELRKRLEITRDLKGLQEEAGELIKDFSENKYKKLQEKFTKLEENVKKEISMDFSSEFKQLKNLIDDVPRQQEILKEGLKHDSTFKDFEKNISELEEALNSETPNLKDLTNTLKTLKEQRLSFDSLKDLFSTRIQLFDEKINGLEKTLQLENIYQKANKLNFEQIGSSPIDTLQSFNKVFNEITELKNQLDVVEKNKDVSEETTKKIQKIHHLLALKKKAAFENAQVKFVVYMDNFNFENRFENFEGLCEELESLHVNIQIFNDLNKDMDSELLKNLSKKVENVFNQAWFNCVAKYFVEHGSKIRNEVCEGLSETKQKLVGGIFDKFDTKVGDISNDVVNVKITKPIAFIQFKKALTDSNQACAAVGGVENFAQLIARGIRKLFSLFTYKSASEIAEEKLKKFFSSGADTVEAKSKHLKL